jgi:DNA-binding SARP family transcriptional activator
VQFKVLGPLEVIDGGERLVLGGPKQRAVLAVLLLDANRVVPAAQIVERVWGEDAPERAANTLQVYISNLRKLLDPERRAAESRLRTQPPGYELRVADDELDLLQFEHDVAAARALTAAGRPAEAAERFRQALALWRGEPLSDLAGEAFATSLTSLTVRVAEQRVAALEDRIDADLAAGRHSDVISDLDDAIRDHPYRERLRAQRMLALYRSGRQAEALQSYQQARELLLDELVIDPGAELQELERAILRQDPALDVAAAAPAAVSTDDDAPTARVTADDLDLGFLHLADGTRHLLGRQPCTIGRHRENTLAIADANISRRHAVIQLVDGDFVLTDLGSTNGTFVNGVAVAEHRLVSGDDIRLGDTVLRFTTLAAT